MKLDFQDMVLQVSQAWKTADIDFDTAGYSSILKGFKLDWVFHLHTSSQEHIDTVHDVILFGIVRVLLWRDFQDCRDGGSVVLKDMSNIIGNVLIDQDDTNIIPQCKCRKGFLYLLQLGVLLDNQEIGARSSTVANTCQQESSDSVL